MSKQLDRNKQENNSVNVVKFIHDEATSVSAVKQLCSSAQVLFSCDGVSHMCGSGVFEQGYARMASVVSGERCLDWGSAGLGGGVRGGMDP